MLNGMLSKSAARNFFLIGTALCGGAFILLTIDTVRQVPLQTHEVNLTDSVKRGKHLWEVKNCMGCHTLLGEGAYYAPELTKVYERRGANFIDAMLRDPELMYPGQRKMQKYDFTVEERTDLIAFFKWIGEMDLNGFPARPSLMQVAVASGASGSASSIAMSKGRPQVFNQMCLACHSLGGQGGGVGPALDGVGSRLDLAYLESWLRNPQAVKADSKMPKLPLADADIVELSAFLSQLKEGQK
jgi:nitric oxide reductase subunit C